MTQLYAERHDKEGTTMRTPLTIMAIVLAAAAAAVGTIALLVLMLGWPGLTIGTLGATTVFLVYRVLVQPWQHRWGATDEDVCRAMPGDDLVPDAASTTRAITIAAPPEQVWPWLVQLGYGRAGWYSYDWIDNDSRPSADRILLVAGDQQAGSWCLAVYPTASGSRLVSRWRVNWPLSPATAFWILVSDPGAFIMERKMLKGIRTRAERPARSADSGLDLDQHQVDVVAAAARLRRPRSWPIGGGYRWRRGSRVGWLHLGQEHHFHRARMQPQRPFREPRTGRRTRMPAACLTGSATFPNQLTRTSRHPGGSPDGGPGLVAQVP